jgi:dihydrofolate synthase/folylpolyglutamate synthase
MRGMRLGLAAIDAVCERLGRPERAVPSVLVAGTNGKGSAAATLSAIAEEAGIASGLYTSPHLESVTERIRIRRADVSAGELDAMLAEVFAAADRAPAVPVTYFEAMTAAAILAFARAPVELAILEVGLGGRLDAVNAFDNDCAIVTSIDIDHSEYLGSDRESIGREKAGVMRAGKPAIVSDPLPPQSVIAEATRIGADLWLAGRDFRVEGDRQQWSWSGRAMRLGGLGYPALRGANQLLNAAGALAAFEALRERLPVSAQAIRTGLATVELPGRFQVVPGAPAIVLDVGHNPHAIAALALNLDQMGFFPRTHAVFGVMRDKDVAAIVVKLAPLVDAWHLTDLPTPRAASAAELAAAVRGVAAAAHATVAVHARPADALAAAMAEADPADRIVVFGSFFTVGGVLENAGGSGHRAS